MLNVHARIAATLGLSIVLALPAAAQAHDGSGLRDDVKLHVGTSYDSCYFDLHAELSSSAFRQFAAEAGQMVHFRQISSADTLGAGTFDVSVGYEYFLLDDTKSAWNDTMTHPQADHYLGRQLGIPYLALRAGITDRVDGEVFGTVNAASNYGAVGLASKIRILEQNDRVPVSVAVRPSASALLGPSEVQVYHLGTDVSVSRRFGSFAPFAGVAMSSTVAVDNSADTDAGNQAALRAIAFAGVDVRWRFISVGAQAEISDLPAFDVRVGGRF